MIEIESGIPIPPEGRKGGPKPKYRIDQMKIGDSMFLTTTNARRAATAFAQRRRIPIIVRAVTEGGVDGFRLWRTGDVRADAPTNVVELRPGKTPPSLMKLGGF